MNFTKPSPRQAAGHQAAKRQDGAYRHLDGSVLERPFTPTRPVIICAIAGALVAALIGGSVAAKAIDWVLFSAARTEAAIAENISRDVAYEIPLIQELIELDNDAILQLFADSGFTTYSYLDEDDDSGEIDLMKIPSDTTYDEAAAVYSEGVSNADGETASLYLVGSWRFTCSRDDYIDMRIRYADFDATDASEAIANAKASQGWDVDETVVITDEGTDSVGNTYQEGTVTTDSGTYTWRISVCDLDEVYDVSGLPETAQYVGIRMTA